MWPRMWEIIEHLGLGAELRQVSGGSNPTGALHTLSLPNLSVLRLPTRHPAQPVHICKADEAGLIEFFKLPPTCTLFSKHLTAGLTIYSKCTRFTDLCYSSFWPSISIPASQSTSRNASSRMLKPPNDAHPQSYISATAAPRRATCLLVATGSDQR